MQTPPHLLIQQLTDTQDRQTNDSATGKDTVAQANASDNTTNTGDIAPPPPVADQPTSTMDTPKSPTREVFKSMASERSNLMVDHLNVQNVMLERRQYNN